MQLLLLSFFFIPIVQPLAIVNNTFRIKQNRSISITTHNIDVAYDTTLYSPSDILFNVTYVDHCRFFLFANSNISVSRFSYQNLTQGMVGVQHDGTILGPFYSWEVTDGQTTVSTNICAPFFIRLPNITTNNIYIKQSQTVSLTINNISVVYEDDSLIFQITSISNGKFCSSETGMQLQNFTWNDLVNNKIQFVHNGSMNPPNYTLVVYDGSDYSIPSSPQVTFFVLPYFIHNNLTLRQNNRTIVTSSMILALGGQGQLFISVLSTNHMTFYRNDYNYPFDFSMNDVNNSYISVQQDGTFEIPSYTLSVADGFDASSPSIGQVNIIQNPNISRNQFDNVKQGRTFIVDDSMIFGYVGSGFNLTFNPMQLTNGWFSYVANPSVPIFSFLQYDIQNKRIQFTHDGSLNPPYFILNCNDGFIAGNTLPLSLLQFTLMPKFLVNKITIEQGGTLLITKEMLDGTIPSNPLATFSVVSIKYCMFQTGVNFNFLQFSTNQIAMGLVKLVHDGSVNPPLINLSITYGNETVTNDSNVTFLLLPKFINNRISIKQGQQLVLNNSMISAETFNGSGVAFMIGDVKNCYFKDSSGNALRTFQQSDIDNQTLVLVHDNSKNAPVIQISILYGTTQSPSVFTEIDFQANVILINNKLVISRKETVLITLDFLKAIPGNSATIIDDSLIIFFVSNVKAGFFFQNGLTKQQTLIFTQKQIAEGQISFVHDGSNRPPSYSVTVKCLDSSIGPFSAYVTFDALQVPLVLVNQAVISQGQRLVFSDQNLLGNSDPSQNSAFIFRIFGLLHCNFETISSPNIPITSFDANQLNTGQIILVHDNSLDSPSYSVSLTNTILSLTSDPSTASISFNILPTLGSHRFKITRGEATRIKTTNLNAMDLDSTQALLTFIISSISNGRFERVTSMGLPCNRFTQ